MSRNELWQYQAELARVWRLQGRHNEALKLMEMVREQDQVQSAVRLEAGLCRFLLGDHKGAVEQLRHLRQDRDLRIRCEANLAVANVEFGKKRYKPCIMLCEAVIKDGNAALNERRKQEQRKKDGYEDAKDIDVHGLPEAIREAKELLEKARTELMRTAHGDDFYRYVQARQAQMAGRYVDAVKLYEQIRKPLTPQSPDAGPPGIKFPISQFSATEDIDPQDAGNFMVRRNQMAGLQPKTFNGIPFDVQPTVMEVPRKSLAADYAGGRLPF